MALNGIDIASHQAGLDHDTFYGDVDAWNKYANPDGTKWIDVYTKTETDSAIADKALKQGTITIPVANVTATPDDEEYAT